MKKMDVASCHLTGRETVSCGDLVVGKTYSRVYIGSNAGFGKINGKETFMVVGTQPLQISILHDRFAKDLGKRLSRGPITFLFKESAFAEFLVYETPDEKDWFVKSVWTTLEQAFLDQLLTQEDMVAIIKKSNAPYARKSYGEESYFQADAGKTFYVRVFDVEGRSKTNPYLQRIYIRWESMEELEADLYKYAKQIKKNEKK